MAHRTRWLLGWTLSLSLLGLAACRPGVPVIDTGPKPANPNGTISGTVRGPEASQRPRRTHGRGHQCGDRGASARDHQFNGGLHVQAQTGNYRVELMLRQGESLIKQPGIIDLDKSDVDAHADFVLAVARTSHPLHPGSLATPTWDRRSPDCRRRTSRPDCALTAGAAPRSPPLRARAWRTAPRVDV